DAPITEREGVHAVRTGAVLLQKYSPPPDRRSTRPGCDICPAIRTEAVLLHRYPPRAVGAPAPGANMCRGGDAGGIAAGRRFGDAVQHRDQPRDQGPEPCASLNRESPSSAPDWRG